MTTMNSAAGARSRLHPTCPSERGQLDLPRRGQPLLLPQRMALHTTAQRAKVRHRQGQVRR